MAVDSKSIPPVYGLILAGGQSSRMGSDKFRLDFHGEEQYIRLYRLLSAVLSAVYISARGDQDVDSFFPVIVDQHEDMGPIAGVLTAMEKYPYAAWLVVACDLPFVDEVAIGTLLDARQPEVKATYFTDPSTGFPEPLFSLLEPALMPVITHALREGNSSLNRILRSAQGQGVPPSNPDWLISANTPEDVRQIREKLKR